VIEIQLIQSNKDLIHISVKTDNGESTPKPYLHSINILELRQSIDEVTTHIPNTYLRNGADIHLLERLKKEGLLLFQKVFSDFGSNIIDLKSVLNPKRIKLFVDEACGYFPFEVLYDGEHFLSDGFIVSRDFINKNNFNSIKKCSHNNQITFIGDPSEDKNIESSVKNEIHSIIDTLPEDLVDGPYFGNSVRKISLIRTLSHSSVFHYSGHYDAGRGWRLSENEYFTISDVHQLMFAPQLVIDNSCGEPNFDWVQSFLNEGVKSVIATSESIPSDVAQDFGIQLYKKLTSGVSLGEAYFNARNYLIEKRGQSDLSWLFFNLYGNTEINPLKKLVSKIVKNRWKKYLIKTGIATLFLGFILVVANSLNNNFESIEREFYSKLTDVKVKKINSTKKLPLEFSLFDGDIITFEKNGYYESEYKCTKVGESWELIPMNNIYFILDNNIVAVPTLSSDRVEITLADSTLKKKTLFYKDKFKVRVQGTESEIVCRDSISLYIGKKPYLVHAYVDTINPENFISEKVKFESPDNLYISNWK